MNNLHDNNLANVLNTDSIETSDPSVADVLSPDKIDPQVEKKPPEISWL